MLNNNANDSFHVALSLRAPAAPPAAAAADHTERLNGAPGGVPAELQGVAPNADAARSKAQQDSGADDEAAESCSQSGDSQDGDPEGGAQEACQAGAELLQRRRLLAALRLPLEHRLSAASSALPEALLDAAAVCLMPPHEVMRLLDGLACDAPASGGAAAPMALRAAAGDSSKDLAAAAASAAASPGLATSGLASSAGKAAGTAIAGPCASNERSICVFRGLPLLLQLSVLQALRHQLSAKRDAMVAPPALAAAVEAAAKGPARRHAEMATAYVTSQRSIVEAALQAIAALIGQLFHSASAALSTPPTAAAAARDAAVVASCTALADAIRLCYRWPAAAVAAANCTGAHPAAALDLHVLQDVAVGGVLACTPLQCCFVASDRRLLALQLAAAACGAAGEPRQRVAAELAAAVPLPPAAALVLGNSEIECMVDVLEGGFLSSNYNTRSCLCCNSVSLIATSLQDLRTSDVACCFSAHIAGPQPAGAITDAAEALQEELQTMQALAQAAAAGQLPAGATGFRPAEAEALLRWADAPALLCSAIAAVEVGAVQLAACGKSVWVLEPVAALVPKVGYQRSLTSTEAGHR